MADKDSVEVGMDLLRTLYGSSASKDIKTPPPATLSSPTIEVSSVPEKLPPVELEMPIRFAGKIFDRTAAEDHFGDSRIKGIYDHHIVNSNWAHDNIYTHKPVDPTISVKPGNFSTPRPHIYAVFWGPEGLTQTNIKWVTEGDYAMEMGIEPSQGRIFPATEMRILNRDQMIDLNQKGYSVWSALTDTENLMWRRPGGRPHSLHGRNIQNGVERLTVDSMQPSLWEDKKWLEDDSHVSSIADAFLGIVNKAKLVRMPKPDPYESKKSVQLAQALSQMVSARTGKMMYWNTERDLLNAKFHLAFVPGNVLTYPMNDEIFITPQNSRINDENRSTVAAIRQSFSKRLPNALETWRSLG